jgi:hypothetical protein
MAGLLLSGVEKETSFIWKFHEFSSVNAVDFTQTSSDGQTINNQ